MLKDTEMFFYVKKNPNVKLMTRWLLLFDLLEEDKINPFTKIPESEVDNFSVFLYRKLYDLHKNNTYLSIKDNTKNITPIQAEILDYFNIKIEFIKKKLQKIRLLLRPNNLEFNIDYDKKKSLLDTYLYIILRDKNLFKYFSLYVYFDNYLYDNSKHIEEYFKTKNYTPPALTYDYITNKIESLVYDIIHENLSIVKFRKKEEKYLPEAFKSLENYKNLNFKYKIPNYTYSEYTTFDEKLKRKQVTNNNIIKLHNEVTKALSDFYRNFINNFSDQLKLSIIMTPNLLFNPYEEDEGFFDDDL